MKPALFIVIFFISAVIIWVLWRWATKASRDTQKHIQRIKQRSRVSGGRDISLRRRVAEAQGLIYWLTKPLPDFKTLGNKLERAGKSISPKKYVFNRLLTMFVITFVISGVLRMSLWLGLPVGAVVGIWLPLKLLNFSVNKQNKAFLRLFPDAIDLIVRGLRSGLPVSESLVLVGQEVPDPVGSVFKNISNTMKLGVPLEKALQETAKKLSMTEFNFFTTSIILQRETGGNLSEILNNLSEVLRNRYIMRMKIKAMSSEARASAYIIGALPFVVILAVGVVSPGYMTPLYTDPTGNICAGVAAFMMIFGMWFMNRMTQFEI